jgi:rhamnulokinase
MASGHSYLAIDLGAESGRAITALLAGDQLTLAEVHRFSNQPVRLPDGLHWDVLRLWAEIKSGIAAASKSGGKLEGIGLDTWGVDFALLDRSGSLLANPIHYRDRRTDGMLEAAFQRVPRDQIFAQTGIQFMQINSLYQLFAMVLDESPLFEIAETFLTIPDLFNYWLSGEIACEFTNATTTQCFDPRRRDWAFPLLEALQIPGRLFRPVTQPGTVIGSLLPELADEFGSGPVPVVLPACHDTGSAVVAVPAQQDNFAWISSGTWSILGCETREPSLTPQALDYNFTNEGGVQGTWRLSKNVMGLWLVQECKRTWAAAGEDLTYDEITRQAAEARPFTAVIDVDDNTFFHPGDMPGRVQAYCQRTGQAVPQSKGQIVRVILESLALKYRLVLERLETLTGTRLDPIHIIGGGTKNRLLSQFIADCTGRRCIAGPIEATAIGNILMQAIGLGHLESLPAARAVVCTSFAPDIFEPANLGGWDEAYAQLQKVISEC